MININNEFDVDLSQMNEKIKNILNKSNSIENKLEYNLGNILIKNVKVQPILYYTNNFFDTNINKQQFILFNDELKEKLKNQIRLDYDLIKSLIESQNNKLLNDLKSKIKLEKTKINKLLKYIGQNKINNNIYKYQNFCENYNYHLEEELKKIQNHKNIFKYYDHLVCTFIYYYENNDQIDMSNSNNINNLTEDNKKEIKEYSKTNIIKRIKEEFEEMIEININRNVINFEKMLIESNDIEDESNPQLKKEFTSICLSIDLVVGNMYSKLLKRFLLEYLTDKYNSEFDDTNDNDKLVKIKKIINNIMTKVDDLINIKYEENKTEPTEFTKKLVILHSEGRYQIKEYAELNEDNLFDEIVNLIKSNSYEKIEEDDIILTYLRNNINDYFKKFYKIAIKTLIACSSGINNYILYHNKYSKISQFLRDKLKESGGNKNNNNNKESENDKIKRIKNLFNSTK